MTIEQLIDELASVGAVTGLQAEVQAWHLGPGIQAQPADNLAERATANPGPGTGPQPLAVLRTTGVSAGWERHTQRSTAIIKIA